jgi:pilus assembly protein Flp/PilA
MKTLVTRFVKDESGATAIEYGLIAAGISVAIITVVKNVAHESERNVYQRAKRAPVHP